METKKAGGRRRRQGLSRLRRKGRREKAAPLVVERSVVNSFRTKSPWIYAGGEELKSKERKNIIKGKEKKRFVTNLATKG